MKFRHILVMLLLVVTTASVVSADKWLCCDDRATRCSINCNYYDSYIQGDYCYYSKSYSSCGCYYEYREYCPSPGTVKGSLCYYGSRSCDSSGCSLNTCYMGNYDRCDPVDGCEIYKENCDLKDGEYGSQFCKSGDVFIQYRDYYWNGHDCNHRTYDKKVQDCNYGCENGYCVQSENCDERDGEYGSRYCKNNDVYAEYRDYYRSGGECKYRTSDKKLEDCRYDCANGQCADRRENCDAKDGEYESRFCKSGDVYVQYRDYYWNGYECRYDSRDKKAEDCSYDCQSGRCVYKPRVNCDSMDGEYGERFCKSGDVYVEYRNYYYADYGKCLYESYDKKAQSCPDGCDNGKCMPVGECSDPYGKRSDKVCKDGKIFECWDGFWVFDTYSSCPVQCQESCGKPREPSIQCSNYCMDNKWYHSGIGVGGKCNYIIDDCSSLNKCVFVDGQKICYTYECSNGCVQTGETVEYVQLKTNKTLDFNIDVSLTGTTIAIPEREKLFNGILFGHNKIELPVDGYVESVDFTVEKTNHYGNLEIWADGVHLYSSKPDLGRHVISINKTIEKLQIFAGSSAWKLWSPSIYEIDAKIRATAVVPGKQSFDFEVSEYEISKVELATITVPNQIRAYVNGHEAEGIMSKEYLKSGTNIVVFESLGDNFEGVSSITMFFR